MSDMIARSIVETLLALTFTLALITVALVSMDLMGGQDLATAFGNALETFVGLLVIPLGAAVLGWFVTNIVARSASSTRRFWVNLAVLGAVTVVSGIVIVIVFAVGMGGWAVFFAAIAMVTLLMMFIAGTVSLLMVHFVFLRRPSSKPHMPEFQSAPNP